MASHTHLPRKTPTSSLHHRDCSISRRLVLRRRRQQPLIESGHEPTHPGREPGDDDAQRASVLNGIGDQVRRGGVNADGHRLPGGEWWTVWKDGRGGDQAQAGAAEDRDLLTDRCE